MTPTCSVWGPLGHCCLHLRHGGDHRTSNGSTFTHEEARQWDKAADLKADDGYLNRAERRAAKKAGLPRSTPERSHTMSKHFDDLEIDNGHAEVMWGRDWVPDWLWSVGFFLFGVSISRNSISRWIFFKDMTAREQMDIFGGDDE